MWAESPRRFEDAGPPALVTTVFDDGDGTADWTFSEPVASSSFVTWTGLEVSNDGGSTWLPPFEFVNVIPPYTLQVNYDVVPGEYPPFTNWRIKDPVTGFYSLTFIAVPQSGVIDAGDALVRKAAAKKAAPSVKRSKV